MIDQPKQIVSTFVRSAGLLGLALALNLSIAPSASADDAAADLPTPEKLIAAAIEAQGGQKAFDAIKSIRTKGTMNVPQMGSMEIETHFKRDGRFFITQRIPMMGEMKIGYDGEVGWLHQPQRGYQLLGPEEVAEIRSTTITHDMLLRLRTEFSDMRTVEQTSFAGTDSYKVRMVHKEHDREQFAYFGAENKRILGVEVQQESDFGPMSITLTFDEWKTRGDVSLFTKTTLNQMGMEMVMELSEIELDGVDDSLFELPEEIKKLAAEQKQREESEEDEGGN